MPITLRDGLAALAESHRAGLEPVPIGLGDVSVMRAHEPSGPLYTVYEPVFCLVAQGAKQATIGETMHEFSAGQSLVVSVELPAIARVVRASPEAPYLALAAPLKLDLLREIMAEMSGREAGDEEKTAASYVHEADEELFECGSRLIRLASRPDSAAVLLPSLLREMHYWLLAGRQGDSLRRMARPDGQGERVARAVRHLRREFARPMRVETLAEIAHMSVSSFHHHFKAVTSMTPLQYQKQLRLIEARRLLLAEATSAAHAAYSVGYESVPQFTREYARMFGTPPKRDADRLRATA
ncbi:AraC family transcriptional regulator [Lutibaculum baratangense]|uniref:Transcriptional regulator, AraC family n=1 Tax=Lutibaculum baratangense AMV1 TaxID=631454 RepID=V4RL35_9HYPH|nr:AraC family transcriptional regulator [Lutibaculum baratangense]ESR26014.1 Transcriptional regulator, AraC family [Lutibaculum baratangense AMV1]